MNREQQLEQDNLRKGLDNEARIIRYDYTVSIILFTFTRMSKPVMVLPFKSPVLKGMKYNLITLLFGWWGIPMGPVHSLASLFHNFRGGSDCTAEIAEKTGWELTSRVMEYRTSETRKKTARAARWARYSVILGICSLILNYLSAIFGIILGHRAYKILKRYDTTKGLSTARAGLIINYSYCVVITIVLVILNHSKS